MDFGLETVKQPGVYQGLLEALVGLLELDILADHADLHRIRGMLDALHQFPPPGHFGVSDRQFQLLENNLVETLRGQGEGHFVD